MEVTNKLNVLSSLFFKINTVTATTTLTAQQSLTIVNNGATNVTLALPTVVGNEGLTMTIIRAIGSTGTITISTFLSEKIEALNGALVNTTSITATGTRGSKVTFIVATGNWIRLLNG